MALPLILRDLLIQRGRARLRILLGRFRLSQRCRLRRRGRLRRRVPANLLEAGWRAVHAHGLAGRDTKFAGQRTNDGYRHLTNLAPTCLG
ncbi:hypothetical protein [Mycobacterium sp. GA-1285]|uniref:hypothetical protein n=1 Tax=Mycobacterium sp. GA-1285 TaxID=1772282 RepID=UPI0012E358B0|nr:hypothetical protein [Mycobacterium sp. GA-1285]